MALKKKAEEEKDEHFSSLSRKEALILEMLVVGGGNMYGLEMVEGSGGELKRGTIYVTLQRMEEKGFIESRQEARPAPEVGIPRRVYQATGHGSRVFMAYRAAKSVMNSDLMPARG